MTILYLHFKNIHSGPPDADEKSIVIRIITHLHIMHYFSLTAFRYVCLIFSSGSLIIMCLCLDSFEFILFRTCWNFQICKFIPFNKIGGFSAIQIFLFCITFFNLLLWLHWQMLDILVLSHQSLKPYLLIFLSFYYLLFRLDNFEWFIFKVTDFSVSLLFWLSYFSSLECLISLFYILSLLAETFHLSI